MAGQIFNHDSIMLSAQKTGYPNLLTSTLSSRYIATANLSVNGISAVSLATNDVGITWNVYTRANVQKTLNSVYNVLSVQSPTVGDFSIFRVDTGYSGSPMSIVPILSGTNTSIQYYNAFTFLSAAGTTVQVLSGALSATDGVVNPEVNRKYLLGYI